jgi:hypothetical protein
LTVFEWLLYPGGFDANHTFDGIRVLGLTYVNNRVLSGFFFIVTKIFLEIFGHLELVLLLQWVENRAVSIQALRQLPSKMFTILHREVSCRHLNWNILRMTSFPLVFDPLLDRLTRIPMFLDARDQVCHVKPRRVGSLLFWLLSVEVEIVDLVQRGFLLLRYSLFRNLTFKRYLTLLFHLSKLNPLLLHILVVLEVEKRIVFQFRCFPHKQRYFLLI